MFVSIIIPTLNEEDYIGTLLEGLALQTTKDFEVIIVDGESTDKTQDKVLTYKDLLNIQFVKSKKGVANQRNLGATFARGEHLMFMDADGYVDSNFLEKVTKHLEKNPKIDVLTAWIQPMSDRTVDHAMFAAFNRFYMEIVKKWKPVAGGAFICIKKKVFEALHGFDPDILVGEDYDLIYRAHATGYNYDLLKNPRIYTSVRRLDKMGRAKYLMSLGKAKVYYDFRKKLKNVNWMNYKMDDGGAYYKDKTPQ